MISLALFHFLCSLTVLLLLPLHTSAGDPDPMQDFCVADLQAHTSVNGYPCKPAKSVTANDFFFDGFTKEGNTSNNLGSALTIANVNVFPALNTLGVAMGRVDLAPGGLNPPHIHPRATEAGIIIEGKVLIGFVTTANVFHSKELSVGQMFVVPKGLLHFQLNVGQGKALIYTALNSHLPGSVIVSNTLFASSPAIPEHVLTKAFQADKHTIDTIRSKFGAKA
ncbi:hypothetical protein Tsubulata_006690 [Turnera subulata]|uniref:Germin-like protein n=1 Tax=Turnera subulata TaxID=218843 RepID=A0A9Q0GJG0_9ROSI|nr:hypothetical protein Tsubulata_006690 [Turnera subulata]